jgi:hypothetical protein
VCVCVCVCVSNKQGGIKRPCGQRVTTNSKIAPNCAKQQP